MKKLYPLFMALILATFVLASCGGEVRTTPVAIEVIDALMPTPVVMGNSITFFVGETKNLTNDSDIIAVTYKGVENEKHMWECVSISGKDCAERHGEEVDMFFFLSTVLVGETSENSAVFAANWKVIK